MKVIVDEELEQILTDIINDSKDIKDTIWYDETTTMLDKMLYEIQNWLNMKS